MQYWRIGLRLKMGNNKKPSNYKNIEKLEHSLKETQSHLTTLYKLQKGHDPESKRYKELEIKIAVELDNINNIKKEMR